MDWWYKYFTEGLKSGVPVTINSYSSESDTDSDSESNALVAIEKTKKPGFKESLTTMPGEMLSQLAYFSDRQGQRSMAEMYQDDYFEILDNEVLHFVDVFQNEQLDYRDRTQALIKFLNKTNPVLHTIDDSQRLQFNSITKEKFKTMLVSLFTHKECTFKILLDILIGCLKAYADDSITFESNVEEDRPYDWTSVTATIDSTDNNLSINLFGEKDSVFFYLQFKADDIDSSSYKRFKLPTGSTAFKDVIQKINRIQNINNFQTKTNQQKIILILNALKQEQFVKTQPEDDENNFLIFSIIRTKFYNHLASYIIDKSYIFKFTEDNKTLLSSFSDRSLVV